MLNPLTIDFWRDEERRLWEELEPLAMAALLAGATGALRVMPAPLEELVDFDFVNRAAQRYLQEYRLNTVGGINATTRERAVSLINDWLEMDEDLDVLRRKMRPLFGESRADTIAVTEVGRTISAGNMALWNSTGVVAAKRWRTVSGTGVCAICSPLEGRIVEINGNFSHTAAERAASTVLQKALSYLGTGFQFPPAHPNCRCFLQPVVSEELLRREIGDILTQEFVAQVEAGKYDVFIAKGDAKWQAI